ncbi:MAG: hypothetical protein V9H25_07550 [Candidatus Competibacter sp.]
MIGLPPRARARPARPDLPPLGGGPPRIPLAPELSGEAGVLATFAGRDGPSGFAELRAA